MNKTLTDIIYQYKEHSFSYPEGFDCAVFVARVIEEYTGKDIPIWKEITTYRTPEGAMETIKKMGCTELYELPELILGNPKKPMSEAKVGEPVYYINEWGVGILGVCNGFRSYFLQKNGGLTARNTEECKYCWSVN